jgi:quercetin dioxygenase-like cupin family protein
MTTERWRRYLRGCLPVFFGAVLVALVFQERLRTATRVTTQKGAAALGGYVLGPDEGEAITVPNGRVVVKVDPRTGSTRFAVGTQLLTPGNGIALHLHEVEDEVLYLSDGARTVVVGDSTKAVVKGTTVFVPHGVWHGVMAAKDEAQVIWIVSPPGLESFFREVGSPPGALPQTLTPERMAEIRRKHGMQSK